MKRLIILLVVVGAIITSCASPRTDYSVEEIQTLVAIGKFAETGDSISVVSDEGIVRYPIVKSVDGGYFPALCDSGYIRYYQVKE